MHRRHHHRRSRYFTDYFSGPDKAIGRVCVFVWHTDTQSTNCSAWISK